MSLSGNAIDSSRILNCTLRNEDGSETLFGLDAVQSSKVDPRCPAYLSSSMWCGYLLEKTEKRTITLKRNHATQEEYCEIQDTTDSSKPTTSIFTLFIDDYFSEIYLEPANFNDCPPNYEDNITIDKAVMLTGDRFATCTTVNTSLMIDHHKPITEKAFKANEVAIWDIASKKCVHRLKAKADIQSIISLSDGNLATITNAGTVEFWDIESVVS